MESSQDGEMAGGGKRARGSLFGRAGRRAVWVALAALVAIVLAGVVAVAARQLSMGPQPVPAQTQTQTVQQQQSLVPGMPICAPPERIPGVDLPTPPSEPQRPPAAFGLAWFHKPPSGDTTPQQMAAEHSYIHLTGPSDAEYRDALRKAGYTQPILTYVAMNSVEGPGPYADSKATCNTQYMGYDNNVAFQRGDFCRYIHPNESWFLHNSRGERIVDDYFGTGRWSYLMNPADPGWRAFSQSRLKLIKDEWGYDGLWLDNLDLNAGRAQHDVTNSDGTVREFASGEAWREAERGWLEGLRAVVGRDYPVWANLVGGDLTPDAWDAYAPYLDGAMDESFAVSWLDGQRTPEEWAGQIERARRWLAAGKGLVMVGQGNREDGERLRFTLASYLLVAEGDRSFFRYTRYDTYYDTLWLFPDYDTARKLGMPTGSCREIAPGIWRRDFSGGYVEVTLSDHTGRLVLQP